MNANHIIGDFDDIFRTKTFDERADFLKGWVVVVTNETSSIIDQDDMIVRPVLKDGFQFTDYGTFDIAASRNSARVVTVKPEQTATPAPRHDFGKLFRTIAGNDCDF